MTLTAPTQIPRRKCKPFLVLSVIDRDLQEKPVEVLPEMAVKNPGLNLFIKTWPPKLKSKSKEKEEKRRPLTATLEKPLILDVRLAKKIDMSKIKKEFLNISAICRMPLMLKSKKALRPLSLPPPEKKRGKKNKMTDVEDNYEDDESISIKSTSRTRNTKSEGLLPPKSKKFDNSSVINSSLLKPRDANNNTKPLNPFGTYKVAQKPSRQRHALPINLKTSVNSIKIEQNRAKSDMKTESNNSLNGHITKSTKHGQVAMSNAGQKTIIAIVPEPCTTCGRANHPERLHSHPETTHRDSCVGNASKKMEVISKMPVKSTVQKPIAIKYKSKRKSEQNNLTFRKTPPNLKKLPPTILPEHTSQAQKVPEIVSNRIRSAKRTLTCYLCGREFGSASLPIHEPKCLEKWERENSNLPPHLQRKPPTKPDHGVSQEEWNKAAWEAAQSSLVPCKNCGRTFYPDRLVVHQRSCKTPQNIKSQNSDYHSTSSSLSAPMTDSTPSTPSSTGRPPAIECYICGKLFGSKSIIIHEKQCLKKWHQENDMLPPDMRSPPPTKSDHSETLEPVPTPQPSTHQQDEKASRPSSSRKPPLFPCYLCGKLFTVNSIYIHEPHCLKRWKIENDKLPPHKRRQQPLKPDIQFTRDGKIDLDATVDEMWQTHLNQLVPCRLCSRTFNPDRVEVHERSCKGL